MSAKTFFINQNKRQKKEYMFNLHTTQKLQLKTYLSSTTDFFAKNIRKIRIEKLN